MHDVPAIFNLLILSTLVDRLFLMTVESLILNILRHVTQMMLCSELHPPMPSVPPQSAATSAALLLLLDSSVFPSLEKLTR